MSGGHWDYKQYFLSEVVEDINNLVSKNGREKTSEEMKLDNNWDKEWYEKYPEDKFYTKYSDETIEHFKQAFKIVKEAQIYIQRLDYLLSGDNGEESFLSRLKEELNK